MKLALLDRLFVGILLVIFAGIAIHAPLTVGLGTLFPDYSLVIKSWKEILMGVALLLAVVLLTTKRQWGILKEKLIIYIAGFAGVTLILIPAFYQGFDATVAGLFIDLRFFLYFVLVYVAVKLYPQLAPLFVRFAVAGALLVVVFALLQLTVLPHDFLKHIGYGQSTIMPYLTVDENINYVRINSTLRGPNPLGAYAVIVLAGALAYGMSRLGKKVRKSELTLILVLGLGSVVALWASYSRSAALAAAAAVGVVLIYMYGPQKLRGAGVAGAKVGKIIWISLVATMLILAGSLVALKDTQFVSQVILHEDPSEGNNVNSNDGHADSLADGFNRMVRQPLGAGIGSTGSASLMTEDSVIIENHYLFVAHEAGWLGLALFLAVNYMVLQGLWKRRTNWIALGVFASGVGLAIAALFLPVWADDTVAIIWWGLAAVCLAMPGVGSGAKGAAGPYGKAFAGKK